MTVKCGRTGGGLGVHYHDDITGVRACYNGGNAVAQKSTVTARDRLSEKQVSMVNILMKKLGLVWDGETPVEELAKWGTGRTLIDQLKDAEQSKAHGQPFTPPTGTKIAVRPFGTQTERAGKPEDYPVDEGLYATDSLTGNNDLDFWRVKHGRRPGKVFVNRVIGGHQDIEIPADSKAKIKTERVDPVTQRTALKAILAAPGGPAAAMELAGIELKFCRRCGTHLTDKTSRALGIGPDCRSK
jgi:hypothetical protein